MQVISVQVGKIREASWKTMTVPTGFFKDPVTGPVAVQGVNLAGDEQADPQFHGGEYKAVYSFADEHYTWWKQSLPRTDWVYGMFGENLTTRGLDESTVCIGDKLRVGTVLLEVSQPRMPCSKLNLRFQDGTMVRKYTQARRPGIYYRILEAGVLAAGDAMQIEYRHPEKIALYDVMDFMAKRPVSDTLLKALAASSFLDPKIRAKAQKALTP